MTQLSQKTLPNKLNSKYEKSISLKPVYRLDAESQKNFACWFKSVQKKKLQFKSIKITFSYSLLKAPFLKLLNKFLLSQVCLEAVTICSVNSETCYKILKSLKVHRQKIVIYIDVKFLIKSTKLIKQIRKHILKMVSTVSIVPISYTKYTCYELVDFYFKNCKSLINFFYLESFAFDFHSKDERLEECVKMYKKTFKNIKHIILWIDFNSPLIELLNPKKQLIFEKIIKLINEKQGIRAKPFVMTYNINFTNSFVPETLTNMIKETARILNCQNNNPNMITNIKVTITDERGVKELPFFLEEAFSSPKSIESISCVREVKDRTTLTCCFERECIELRSKLKWKSLMIIFQVYGTPILELTSTQTFTLNNIRYNSYLYKSYHVSKFMRIDFSY